MERNRIHRWLALALLAVPTVARAADGPVTVAVFRPSRVGEMGDEDATVAQHVHEVRTVVGQPPTTRDRDTAVHIVGRYKVEAIDSRGVVTKLKFVVSKAVVGVNGDKSQLLPFNAVLEVTNPAGDTEYAESEGKITPAKIASLRQVLTVRPPGAPTIDEMFPPGGPRSVGDTWPLDVEQMAAYERAAKGPQAKRVKGEAKLLSVFQKQASAWAVVQQSAEAWDGQPTTRPGLTQSLAHSTAVYTQTFPVNLAERGLNTDLVVTNEYVGHSTTADGTAVEVKTRYTTEKHWTITSDQP